MKQLYRTNEKNVFKITYQLANRSYQEVLLLFYKKIHLHHIYDTYLLERLNRASYHSRHAKNCN